MTPERLQEIRERAERERRKIIIGERLKTCLDRDDLLAAYDALSADYAAAIRALRIAEWGSLEMNESDEAVGESCPACHRLEDHRRSYGEYLAGHAPDCPLWAVLSTPRAKGVE